MRENLSRIAIISAEISESGIERPHELDEVNAQRSTGLSIALKGKGFSFSQIKGFYNGKSENSFLVVIHSEKDEQTIFELGHMYAQESVLISRQDRSSYLYFCKTGEREEVGTLQEVDSVEGLHAYSIVKMDGREAIWTCIK